MLNDGQLTPRTQTELKEVLNTLALKDAMSTAKLAVQNMNITGRSDSKDLQDVRFVEQQAHNTIKMSTTTTFVNQKKSVAVSNQNEASLQNSRIGSPEEIQTLLGSEMDSKTGFGKHILAQGPKVPSINIMDNPYQQAPSRFAFAGMPTSVRASEMGTSIPKLKFHSKFEKLHK